jgi:hypothetical protein
MKNGRARKLTWEQVNEMRRLWRPQPVTLKQLSIHFNISKTVACNVIHNRLWKDPKYQEKLRIKLG